MPSNILRNPPICLFVSLLIVCVVPSMRSTFYTFICPKKSDRKYDKWLDIHKDFKLKNIVILSNWIHLKHSSVKIVSITFFSSSGNHQSHHLLECYAIVINSLRFSNLICLTKKLSWFTWKLKHAWWKSFFKIVF